MYYSLQAGVPTQFQNLDPFVDGAAVGKPGDLTLDICKQTLTDVIVVPEGKVCTTILELYNDEGIVVEPAGALTIASLDFYKDKIKVKTIVVVISGGNNDVNRTEEIQRRSKEYEQKQLELQQQQQAK